MSESAMHKNTLKPAIYWIINIILPLVIVFVIPTSNLITMQIKLFFAVTLFAILTFIFENFNRTAIALLLPIAYVIIVKVDGSAAFNPWTGAIPWYMIGGLLLAVILERIGLLKRIAYKIILATGASYKGIIMGIALVGVVLYIFIPGNSVFPMAALAYGICVALGLKPGKASAGIMLTAAVFALDLNVLLYSSQFGMLEAMAIDLTGPVDVQWIDFLFYNLPQVIYFLILLGVIFFMFKPEVAIDGKEYFKTELEKMGPMCAAEKKAAVLLGLLLLAVLTTNYHKVNAMWCFALAPIFLYIPGVNVGLEDDIKGINWSMVVFSTACMGIGTTAGALGIGTILKDMVTPMLDGKSILVIFFGVFIGIYALNLLLTPAAIQAALTVPLVEIFTALGISVPVVYFFMLNALGQIILPYEIPLYLIFFSFGMVKLQDFIKFFITKSVVNLVWVLLVMITYWKMIGIFYV